MESLLLYSSTAFGPDEIQDTGKRVGGRAGCRPGPLHLLVAPRPTCSTRTMSGDCQDWTQVGVDDGAVTGL